jgi:hypothetical protein
MAETTETRSQSCGRCPERRPPPLVRRRSPWDRQRSVATALPQPQLILTLQVIASSWILALRSSIRVMAASRRTASAETDVESLALSDFPGGQLDSRLSAIILQAHLSCCCEQIVSKRVACHICPAAPTAG